VSTIIPTVIIGAGQAGLALSRCLTERGHEHVVLERGRIAERWHTQRWDSFRLLSPNWHTRLPGHRYDGPEPDGFMDRDQVIGMFRRYAESFRAPVRQNTAVERVTRVGDHWQVATSGGVLTTDAVVVATGPHDLPRVPGLAAGLPWGMAQLHAASYRRPDQLPPGGVLVVGAGPSGQQLASELARHGRQVLLAVGGHRRVPRSYRGKDAFWWMEQTGASNVTVDELDPSETRRPGHVVLAAGRELSLDHLAAEGVTLLGRLEAIDGWRAHLRDDLADNRRAAEAGAIRFMETADLHAARAGLDLPDPGPRPSLAPPSWAIDAPSSVDLRAGGIRTVLWATGYRRDYRWIDAPVVGQDGEPRHRRGVSPVPGVFFLGLTWQYRRSSASIDGVGRDARHLAEVITGQARARDPDRRTTPRRLTATSAA
jgi:putative flavoprotein involved in K+ transport